ncbi:oligosaccharyl transferase stt3 subunit [Mucor velutinosus]|uniref:Protein AF-9 homolog n=1 Tax=Mucor velutinosus TaxID=708070 RepID=A0AAN7D640_9FUNG|nr:oligosaccharyl transferase stt3 subunit [Mucor velutinosus]
MMEKRIKINCSSNIIKGKFTNNGDQWRAWTVTLEVPKVDLSEHIDHVEYVLHASFGSPPTVCTEPPYQLQREGWGEFDLLIHIFFKDPQVPSPQRYVFDLNFKRSKYASWRKIILGSDAEYKQEDFMIDLVLEQDRQARARASPRRRPTPKHQQQQEESSGKKTKHVFKRQRTISSTSSFSPTSSPSASSVTSLITPPADSNNKDLQQQQQQEPQHPDVVVQQDPSQNKQKSVGIPPHYILDPANDLSLVLDTETIDLAEFKVLLEALDDMHLRQVFRIMKKYDTSTMDIKTSDDGYYLIDFSTACPDLINELWEFVIDVEIEKCKESSTVSGHQQHEQQH